VELAQLFNSLGLKSAPLSSRATFPQDLAYWGAILWKAQTVGQAKTMEKPTNSDMEAQSV